MHTDHASSKRQRISGWFTICLLASATTMIILAPGSTRAHALESTPGHTRPQGLSREVSTPAPNPPTIIPTPNQGPVGTVVTLQGANWPSGSQVLLSYDSDPGCTGPNLTELSPDPKPTVSSAGTFSANFSWPAVPSTGFWYICAATSDGSATGSAVFNVLSLSPPSLTMLTKGPFMPGQQITVQGKNWFPGGWSISFALQRAHSAGSFPLEESAISLFNGTFSTSVTIPPYIPAGSYVLVATMEQQALQAQSGIFTILATPTPTPTPTPSPSPTPPIIVTPTPIISHHPPPATPHRLSGTLLALVIISGGMAFAFALIGAALLIYLLRSRPMPSATLALEHADLTGQADTSSSE